MPSTRRTFVVGAAAALSGCVAGPDPSGTAANAPNGSPSGTPTDRPSQSAHELGESATVGDLDVRAHDAETKHSYFELVFPDFIGVVASEGRQFVFLSVDVRGGSDLDVPALDDFAIAVRDRTYPGEIDRGTPLPGRDGRPYAREARTGWMRFELPAPVGDGDVRLELDAGNGDPVTWRLGEDVVEPLRRPPPDFRLRDVEAPEEVAADEPIEVAATVENVSEEAGTFRAALNEEGELMYGGLSTSFEVEAGAERTWSETVTTHVGMVSEEEATVRLRFRSTGGDFDRDVVVWPEETTSG